MLVTGLIGEVREFVAKGRAGGRSIGFVPTMGFFHEGHLSLMKRARDEMDRVIVSIFVNPTQFGPAEDFERYPQDPDRDLKLAEETGVDCVFVPEVDEIYPEGFSTYVDVEGRISGVLCGAARPGHFKGVATVCAKLFNIVGPDAAYFGQKDFQQTVVIKRMVEDLNIPLKIVVCPIVREADGLAMSSRNVYLNHDERKASIVIYKSLKQAECEIVGGELDTKTLLDGIERMILEEPLVELEYASICDTMSLDELDSVDGEAVIALAVKIGETRLIDNLMVKEGHNATDNA